MVSLFLIYTFIEYKNETNQKINNNENASSKKSSQPKTYVYH